MAADGAGNIEFFGYQGIDTAGVRRALTPLRDEPDSKRFKLQARQAVEKALGKPPTDVAAICCDENGKHLFFIGLPGANSQIPRYNPTPQGKQRLPSEILILYRRLDQALEAAVRKGGDAAQEDDSQGYALIQDPAARSLQLSVREWALKQEPRLFAVLEFSSDVRHRQVASDAVGYARQSPQKVLTLVRASRDPDGEVRNNATRALGVLVRANRRLAAAIPPTQFIEMLNSGQWTDRNKAAALLMEMTADRSPDLLLQIRSEALDSLKEMTMWRRPSHAFFSRVVLGRVAGIPEDHLQHLAWNGPVEAILDALGKLGQNTLK